MFLISPCVKIIFNNNGGVKMKRTSRERIMLEEILQWEQELEKWSLTSAERENKQLLQNFFDSLPEDKYYKYMELLDNGLFHLQGFIDRSYIQKSERKRLLRTALLLDERIEEIQDLKMLNIDQLSYLADEQLKKQRLYSFVQGAASGTGNVLFVGTDIPFLITLNFQSIHLTALSYGYDCEDPFEMILILKIFHAAIVPKEYRFAAWEQLKEEIETFETAYYNEQSEKVLHNALSAHLLQQIIKTMLILSTKRHSSKKRSLFTMLLSGSFNYKFTAEVTDFAKRFYQYRFLMEEKGGKQNER